MSSFGACQSAQPVRRYVGDSWPFAFFYYTLGSDGVTKTPIVLTGFVLRGLLLRGRGAAAAVLATLDVTTDGTTNLGAGTFKFVAPPAVTQLVPPDPQNPQFLPTRLALVQIDVAGAVTTLGVLPILVSLR